MTGLTPAELRAGAAAHGYRQTVPTDADRQESLRRAQLRQPHGLAEAVAYFLDRAPRYDFVTYVCEGCAWDAAADSEAQVRQLVEHAAYDHPTPCGILGIKPPQAMIHADRLTQWLGRSR